MDSELKPPSSECFSVDGIVNEESPETKLAHISIMEEVIGYVELGQVDHSCDTNVSLATCRMCDSEDRYAVTIVPPSPSGPTTSRLPVTTPHGRTPFCKINFSLIGVSYDVAKYPVLLSVS
jgi:hypothetical protein